MEETINIYDMSMTAELKGVFYERLKDGRYRSMATVCSDKYTIVKDKALIRKLNSIFPKKIEDDET